MRDICKIIEHICEKVIPQTSEHFSLKAQMMAVHKQALYTPPENQIYNWSTLGKLLYAELGDPKTDQWKQDIADIMNDKVQIPDQNQEEP